MEGEVDRVGELLISAVAVVVEVCVVVAAGVPEPVVVMEKEETVVGSGFLEPLGVNVATGEGVVALRGVGVNLAVGVSLPTLPRALGVPLVEKVGVEGAE